MTAHLESFHGPALTEYLTQKHGAVIDRINGSHVHLRLPDGRRVGSLAYLGAGPIPSVLAREVAKTLGITYQQLRSDLGCPVAKRGKSKPPPKRKVTRSGKPDVVRVLDEIKDAVADLQRLRNGQRDPAFYQKAHRRLVAARTQLEGIPR